MPNATSLYVLTDAASIKGALRASVFQPTATAQFPESILGDTRSIALYLITSAGVYDTRSGSATVTPRLALARKAKAPTGGEWTITFGANTTTALAYNITAAALETALNLIASIIAAGGVDVTGGPGGPFTITFRTVGARTAFTASTIDLLPSTGVSIAEVVAGTVSVQEVQSIRLQTRVVALVDTWTQILDGAVPIGWSGTLSTNNVEVLEMLEGATEAEATVEVEVTEAGSKTTLMQQDAKIRYDVINDAALAPLVILSFATTADLAAAETRLGDRIVMEEALRISADALKADKTTSISAIGLATGGGTLAADRNISVTASSNAQAIAGTNATTAMTPAADKAALDAKVDPLVNARATRQAMAFDGTATSFATVTNNPANIGAGDITVATSYFSVSSLAIGATLVGGSGTGFFVLYVDTAGAVHVVQNGTSNLTFPTYVFPLNTPTSLVMTRTGGVAYLYANGVQVSSVACTQNWGGGTTQIGLYGATAEDPKVIGGLWIYNYALSSAEVLRLFATGAPDALDRFPGGVRTLNTSAFSASGGMVLTTPTAVSFSANTTGSGQAKSNAAFAFQVGNKVKVDFTVSGLTGPGNVFIWLSDGVAISSNAGAITANGTYSVTLTANKNTTGWVEFGTDGSAAFVVASLLAVPHALLLSLDANQPGVGPQWRDTSGNNAHVNLPGDGETGGVNWLLTTPQQTWWKASFTANGFLLGRDGRHITSTGFIREIRARGDGTFSLGSSGGAPTDVVNNQTAGAGAIWLFVNLAGNTPSTGKLYATLGTATSIELEIRSN